MANRAADRWSPGIALSKGVSGPMEAIGGLFAMSSGLLLGREGPTVQMAAVIGNSCASLIRLSAEDRAMLYTAVAGAGLAVAFNAPLAGAAFVIEEVARTVSLRRMTVTLTAVGSRCMPRRLHQGARMCFPFSNCL